MCHKQRLSPVLQLIRELGNINVKKKEPPFCYPYSLKARVLVLAHLARMDVSEELEEGKTLKFDVTGIILFQRLVEISDEVLRFISVVKATLRGLINEGIFYPKIQILSSPACPHVR